MLTKLLPKLDNIRDNLNVKIVKLYTTERCPRCERLKRSLESDGVPYKEVDMTTPAALAELRANGVFTTSAPVLKVGEQFFTSKELFDEKEGMD